MRNPVRTTRPAAAPLLVAIALLLWHGAGFAERKALVIGNSGYAQGRLGNPGHDADDMQRRLKDLGFRVTVVKDADKKELRSALNGFADDLAPSDDAVFYYAGHAAQVKGENYLIPIGAEIGRDDDLEDEALRVRRVIDSLAPARNGLKLVILDSCRDNPYASSSRSGTRGLARIGDTPSGTLVWYATEPGKTADDGDGRNGRFTQYLLQGLNQPGLSAEQVFKWTARAVSQASGGQQMPYPEGITLVDFVFKPSAGGRLASAPEPAEPAAPPPPRQRPAPTPAPSRSVKTGDILRDPMKSGGEGPAMVYIEGGSFAMGSPEGEAGRENNERQHSVTVGPYYLAQREVTVADFQQFVSATGYETDAERNVGEQGCFSLNEQNQPAWVPGRRWRNPGFSQTPRDPVVCVSYTDAKAYADWLSGETGQRYGLPTEAEWEYAARAGTTAPRYFGASERDACGYANGADQSTGPNGLAFPPDKRFPCDDGHFFTAPAGSYRANAWGFQDILGNALEWTCSAYDENYGGAERRCAGSSNMYAVRGGGWSDRPAWVRSAGRYGDTPTNRFNFTGFRLSRTL